MPYNMATVHCSPAKIVPPFQSRALQSRTIQSGRHCSPGDNVVLDNLVQANQSQPIQSVHFSPANLVHDNVVHDFFKTLQSRYYVVPRTMQSKTLQSIPIQYGRQCSPAKFSLGDNIFLPFQSDRQCSPQDTLG